MTETAHGTQWPRWEVFKQDTTKRPHQAVGSVHAADAEHALLTARNVFARRPRAVSMWVAPAEDILSMTREELENDPRRESTNEGSETGSYLVFLKTSHRASMTFVDYVGRVEASSKKAALARARDLFTDEEVLVWWIVPEASLTQSNPDEAESWFAPAEEKTYKQQSEYGMVTAKKVKDATGA